MDEKRKKFHEFALKSSLFKGRSDWYFCFLKAERIAQVLAVLAQSVASLEELEALAAQGAELPGQVAYFAAGELPDSTLLADLFSLISAVRLAGVRGFLAAENARVIAQEYELLAQKLGSSVHLSPFASAEDFAVPRIEEHEEEPPQLSARLASLSLSDQPAPIKDIYKRQPHPAHKQQQERSDTILDYVRKHPNVSIKDICSVVRDCSEKTVQRELNALIERGLIKKVGERRWSLYVPILGTP